VRELIGLTGYAQHGKDSVGKVLVEEYGFTRFALAEPLKDLAYRINPIVVIGDNPEVVEILRLQDLVDNGGWERAKQEPEVRRFLQELGTQARKVLGNNVWVEALSKRINTHKAEKPHARVVVTDVRFPNEAAYIYNHGGEVWRVIRPDFDNGVGTDHESERHIDALRASHTVTNDGTLKDLAADVTDIMEGSDPALD